MNFNALKKWIAKHKVKMIILSIFVVLFLVLFIGLRDMLFYNGQRSNYGSRLEGIDKVKITDDTKKQIMSLVTNTKLTSKIKIDIQGRLINIIVEYNENVNLDQAKESAILSLGALSDKEKNFYDIQYILTSMDEKNKSFPAMGLKHKTKDSVVWTKVVNNE